MQLYVVLCFVALLGLSAGQMTFTDQWTKKRAMLHKQQFPVVTPDEPLCPADRVQQVFEQLAQLQKAQQRLTEYLSSCAYPVEMPAPKSEKQQQHQ